MDRCPASVSAGLEDFAEVYLAQLADGTWPAEGARIQQAAWYVRARLICDVERHRIESAPSEAIQRLYGRHAN